MIFPHFNWTLEVVGMVTWIDELRAVKDEEYVRQIKREREEFRREFKKKLAKMKKKYAKCMEIKKENPNTYLDCEYFPNRCPYKAVCPYWAED